jgi:PAS domain S-box-containing protein
LSLIEIDDDTITRITEPARILLGLDTIAPEIKLSEFITEIKFYQEKTLTHFTGKIKNKYLKFKQILTISPSINIYNVEDFPVGQAGTQSPKLPNYSEVLLRSFIEQSFLGICIINSKGMIIEWNKSMSEMYEVERNVYLNKPVWDFDFDYLPSHRKNEKERKRIREFIIDYLNRPDKIVFEAEFEKEIHNKFKYVQYIVFPIQTSEECLFGRINIDISEKKATEHELMEYKEHLEDLIGKKTQELFQSEARMRLLIQSIPMAYYSYDPDDRSKIWYSDQISTLTGFRQEDFEKNPNLWIERINPDDYKNLSGTFERLSFADQKVSCEYRWKDAMNQEIWIYDQAVLIEASGKHPRQIIGCFMDISDRKETENAIIESERNYREIFNYSSDAIIILNSRTGEIEDVNDTMLSMFNTTYNRALTTDLNRFCSQISPYDADHAIKLIEKVLVGEPEHFEWLARKDDGTLFWIDVNLKMVIINGEARIMAIVRDIDEKKKAAEKLEYQHNFEKLILNISTQFINIPYKKVDQNIEKALKEICNFSKTNAGYMFLFDNPEHNISLTHFWQNDGPGIEPGQLTGSNFKQSGWYADLIKKNEVIKLEKIENIPFEAAELRSHIAGKSVHPFIDVPLLYENNMIGFLGLAVNNPERMWLPEEISLLKLTGQIFVNAIKRKESVRTILTSEQTHREIYNAASDAIIVHNIQTGSILDVNYAMLEMFGYTYEEALKVTFKELSSGEGNFTMQHATKLIRATIKKGIQVVEWHAKRKDGSLFWIEMSLKIAEISGKKRVLSVIRDISERKKAAEILRESEEKYRLLIEGQTDLIIKVDTKGRFLFISPSYCELFGKTEEELLGNTYLPLVHKKDREPTLTAMQNLYKPPYTCYVEQRALTKYGWRWLAWSNKAILNDKNEVIEIIGIGRDITYQKGVEEALRNSEDRFRSIVQQLSDIVFIIDSGYNIVYDTPSIKRILNYDEGSLIGKNILEIVPQEDKNPVIEKINNLKKSKDQIVTFETRITKEDGELIPAEFVLINLLHLSSIKGIVLTIRDISERKLLDKKILDAVIKTEEQERERFAKNLHDDLGPLLSSLKMYIGSIKTTSDKEKQDYIITQLNEVVKEAITTTKEVSNDLSPHILINYGLDSAIENFIQKIPKNVKVHFHCTLPSERYSNTIENSFYRILKELINNTLKHSSANKIDIILEEKGQQLNLQYTDNGKGFNMEKLGKRMITGMGISNIISRVKSMNGVYDLDSKVNSGFTFQASIPLYQSLD